MSKEGKPPAALPARGPRNEREAEAMNRYHHKWAGHVAPGYRPSKPKGDVEIDHPDPVVGATLLAEAIGSPHPDFFATFIWQIKLAAMDKTLSINADAVNFTLAVVKGVEPRDVIEIMLATQMAAIHQQVLETARRLSMMAVPEAREAEARMLAKLGRTFGQLVEAFKKHRGNNEQHIKITHVTQNIGENSQVVGVASTGRGRVGEQEKIYGQPQAPKEIAGDPFSTALPM